MFYNFLKQGDIIWAKRYKNKKEKNKIIEGHQEGPYIIIKKGIFSLYALQCTSKIRNIDLDNQYYKLDEKYKLIKKTYVRLINFEKLKYKQFIRKIDELEFSDYNYLLKKISLISKKFKYKFAKGDVIKYKNNTYYIYDVNKKYLCYKTTKKNNNKNIVINNYSFDFNSTHKINKFNKLVLVDCFDKKEIKIISEKQNEICTKRNSKDKRGFLVKIDEKFYLIYDSLLNDFLAYKIYLDNNYKIDMKDITINGGKYYTYFETVKFSKEREFKK